MCGITGYVGEGNLEALQKMTCTLSYRGPDYLGHEVVGRVGFGHTRLSILDLSPLGNQPMWNKDKTVLIVFNGEIYNFKDLKNGTDYKTKTDTEVILSVYDEFGEKVFEKIHGMFAIAIYDTKKEKLFLARDRMGKKPLYWGVYGDTFLFGSELKALVAHPQFKKEVDIVSLNKYFLYEYIPTPNSIFKDTYKLEPGTYLVWDGVAVERKVYWKPSFELSLDTFKDSLARLDTVLSSAVKDRLVADVPVGVFLSGGIDSSVVAYYASKCSRIKTFSIGFRERSFDESGYARRVAKYLGTDHYEKILDAKDCLESIPRIFDMLDEPIADASIVPTYLLSRFTKEYVTVALGGDGGDELFCGYDTFVAEKLATIYEKMPAFLRRIFEYGISRLPTSFSNMSFDFKLKKFIYGFYGDKKGRNQRWLSPFTDTERGCLLKQGLFRSIDTPSYNNLSMEYQKGYMMDQVLVKVDRASMLNSLEIRAPFLDTRVVEFANSLPIDFKMKGFQRKYILKKLMEGKIPRGIIYRKKKGFGMPIAEWIRGDLRDEIETVLSPESLREMNLFDTQYVQKIIKDHVEGIRDNRKQIWTLFVFALWWRKWVQ